MAWWKVEGGENPVMVDDFVQEGMLYDKAQVSVWQGSKCREMLLLRIGFPRVAKLFGTSSIS